MIVTQFPTYKKPSRPSRSEIETAFRPRGSRFFAPVTSPPPIAIEHAETIVLSQQGGLIKSQRLGRPQVGGGTRGKCGPMSRQSRKRLLEKFQSANHRAMSPDGSTFVTLTYAKLPGPGIAKKHLNAFLAWLDRHFDKPVVVWSQELGEQFGRLHFHFIMYARGKDSPDVLKGRLGLAWSRATKGFGGFVHASDVVDPQNVGRYLSKYIAKGSDGGAAAPGAGPADVSAGAAGAGNVPDLTKAHIFTKWNWEGRAWGIRNREKMVFAQKTELAIAITTANLPDVRRVDAMLVHFLRITRRWVKANHRVAVEKLASRLGCMSNHKLMRNLSRHPKAAKVWCRCFNAGKLDWELPVAWAKMGKAHTRWLNPRGEWRSVTLYTPETFDFFAIMEWISSNLMEAST